MGMDAYLYMAHNRKEFNEENWYSKCKTVESEDAWDNYEFDSIAEVWYARKFWDLHQAVFGNDYECGEYVVIDKPTLEKMIEFATHHTDYFGGFQTVEKLCFVLHYYDEMEKHGMVLVYEADW